ncbi:MAG: hypothetical protein PHS60_17405, partial [Zavarzinia sp.]|nr:hypothetical protein [Zavarzinia sp.]
LAPEDARRLLASLPAQGTESRAVLAGDGRDAALAALSALSGRSVPLPRSPAAAGFATPAAVTATVAALGPETAPPDTLIDEVSDYHYLRWRKGASAPWHEEHPAFGATPPPQVTATETAGETIPPAWQHRLRIELFADRLEFDRLVREPLMAPWERPVANLFARPLPFALAPLGAGETMAFVPLLEGGVAPGAKAVNAAGLTGPVDDLASGEGAFFQTIGGKAGGAAEALGALDFGEAPAKTEGSRLGLGRVILRYTLIAPGSAPPRTEERPLLDRILDDGSLAPMTAGAVAERLVQRRAIIIAPGGNHMARTLAIAAEAASARLVALAPLFEAGDQEAVETARKTLGLFTVPSPVAAGVASLLDGPRAVTEGVWRFRPAPAVFSFDEYLWRGNGGSTGIDVITNPWRLLTRNNAGAIVTAPGARVAGATDTWVEGIVVRGASSYMADETVPVTDAVTLAGIDGASLDAIRADLDAGFAIRLLPMAKDGSARWWRIDEARGETLGRSLAGGSELAEYEGLSSRTLLALNAALAGRGIMSCYESHGAGAGRNCCLGGVLGVTIVGGLGGMAVGRPIQAFLAEGEVGFATVLTGFIVEAVTTLLLETLGSLVPDAGNLCE